MSFWETHTSYWNSCAHCNIYLKDFVHFSRLINEFVTRNLVVQVLKMHFVVEPPNQLKKCISRDCRGFKELSTYILNEQFRNGCRDRIFQTNSSPQINVILRKQNNNLNKACPMFLFLQKRLWLLHLQQKKNYLDAKSIILLTFSPELSIITGWYHVSLSSKLTKCEWKTS